MNANSTGEDKLKLWNNQNSEAGVMTLKPKMYIGTWRSLPDEIWLSRVSQVILSEMCASDDTTFS